MQEQIVFLNGEYLPIADARIPVLDRGFIFGDGIYDVAPVYGGVPFRWPQHLARLRRNLDKIRIQNPYDDAGWAAIVTELIGRHPWPDQFVYFQVTRGAPAKREHAFPTGIKPTVFVMTNELVKPSATVIEQGVAAITLPDERWLHCDIKSTSLLGNVLARQAAADAGAFECVQFRDGWMTEGSSSNLWLVKDGKLLAPPRDNLILEGIRYSLMEILAKRCNLPFEVRRISREEVLAADELLVTSATKEILAATRLDGQPVGEGRPGPVFRRMLAAYQEEKAAEQARGWPLA
jgi:D-alanine transaminase